MVTRDLWDEMEGVCVSLDIDTKKALTPKAVIELAKTAELTKTDKKGNVTICKVCKVIERVEVMTKDEQGNEFKVKVAKKDAKGNEVVRYELKTVKAWTPAILVEVIAQANACK